jgi:DNA recombination protein RmuC
MTTAEALWLLVGLAGGTFAAWALLARRAATAIATVAAESERRRDAERQLETARAAAAEDAKRLGVAETRVAEAQRLVAEQQAFVERSRKEMETTFQSLATAAVQGSHEQFLKIAEQRLATARSQAAADVDERKKAIEALVAPLRDTLGKLETRTGEIEKAREAAYSRIDEQVKSLLLATTRVEHGTKSLATALTKSSQERGRWGELALRNVAELAGMTEHCDFELQETTASGNRPDMTVRLPGGRRIAVDAKVPLSGYLAAVEATAEDVRDRALSEHVSALRGHVRALSSRDYQAALSAGVDLVVLFLPGDPFLAAAFTRDPDLQVEALRQRVLIATPTTLVALLRTVAIYHQQESLARNAEEIAKTARELYERGAKFGEDLSRVRRGLETALKAYNDAAASFDSRLVPMARRMEEMKVAEQTKREFPELGTIDELPRALRAPAVDASPVDAVV